MKICTIIGARPQFIKASPLSREISKHSEINEVIIHTGQHFNDNMSKVFFEEMEIPEPTYNLNINSLSHGAMTGRMLENIEKILFEVDPQLVLVYGDTNSTIAGALAAKKLNIKVAHVEAGLRSFDMKMPEEINRIMTDSISDLLFCPTNNSYDNLHLEGLHNRGAKIINSGDVMFDAAIYFSKKAKRPDNFDFSNNFILATFHRQENTDNEPRLRFIINGLNELVDIGNEIIVPIHPRTAKKIKELNLEVKFKALPPVGYLEMLYLLKNCKLVITDSGGLQKEAYFMQKFCLTLRDTTEWVELVENGYNELIDITRSSLLDSISAKLNKKISNNLQLYGNGNASSIIVKEIIDAF